MKSYLKNYTKVFTAFGIFLLVLPGVSAQKVEMFEYTHLEEGDLLIPKFDKSKVVGIAGRAVWTEDKYIHKLFNSVTGSVLSKMKRESLHLNTAVMLAFGRNGEVINCKFFLSSEDRNILTEEDLYRIYMKFKKVRINPYKVKIIHDPAAGNGLPDYAVISGSLISKAGRKRVSKSLEEQRYNNK